MDELKLLIEMVSNLPSLAVWVLIGYLVYKVVVIGSIYGLARFGIEKLHSWLTTPKERLVDVRLMLDGMCIIGAKEELLLQLERVRLVGYSGGYIHDSHVAWLEAAINDKIAKDQKPKA